MRFTLRLMVLLVVVVAMVGGSSALAQKNMLGLPDDVASEKQIHDLYREFTEAWNRHDPAALSRMWGADGDHVEPDGRVAKGREAVAALFKAEHETVFKKTALTLTIDSVWLITTDVALADGNYEIDGIVAPDGTAIPKRTGRLTSVLLREHGKWGIAASRLMIPAPLPYKKN
ncbi:MAG: nuclear transport factor 2 family protein [Candidatus Binatia bacterium]